MTSDWRIVGTPLGKWSCGNCGLAYRDPDLPPPADFSTGYQLYAHPPGGTAEQTRQSGYAAWIAELISPPARVLDVGCGNGSLLLALRDVWPGAKLTGCDLSVESVAFAAAAGFSVWPGTAATVAADRRADLVVSINVIEHTADPRAFVGALAGTLADGGQLVVICPDGARAGVELLIADHLFSFTASHLESFAAAAGMRVCHWARRGDFQMVVARRGAATVRRQEESSTLLAARQRYLSAWQRLDAELGRELPDDVVCFGAGETAGLLRAYAPQVWQRVAMCATDRGGDPFGDRPHVDIEAVPADTTVLVGVRGQDQAAVAARLRGRFAHVVTWYDRVPADDV